MRVLVALAASAACHVTTQSEIVRPGKVDRSRTATPPSPRPPTLVVDAAGRLRFVEPLACATEESVITYRAIERAQRPNMATFVLGIIVTSAGAIAFVNGFGSVNDPLTYAGAAGLAVGLPLAIGPWIGRATSIEALPDGPPLHRAGPTEPCGERALAATHATLEVRGLEVHGNVDGEGVFAISPFQLVDAYEPTAIPPLSIVARVETPRGPHQIETVLERAALASTAATFLSRADFDATVEPMRLVPGLAAGTVRASLTSRDGDPLVRLVLPIENAGPGPSYGLRGHVTATGHPAIDGRVIYIGHLAKGAKLTRELWIPITAAAAETLRNATVELAIELRDAHGTAPSDPLRFRGPLLVDAPR